jgi:glycosyltransferase involved in cell wall biosynthesis
MVGPLPPPIGGVETFMQAMLESSAFSGFDLSHCNTTKGRPRETQGKFDPANFLWAARHLARMAGAVGRVRPDVVYLPIAGTWAGFLRDMALAWVARRSGARLVGHVHGSDFHFVLERRSLDARIVRAGLAQFDRLLVLGERWKKPLADAGVKCPCDVVPSTFRREVFERAAAVRRGPRLNRLTQGLFVGQVGRRKGVFDLLRALARVRKGGDALTLAFVGPPELEGEWGAVQALRSELGLESTTEFTGPLQGDALYARFRGADFFVMPSYTEGLPVVLFEAGVFELPVITTPVGAIPDLIEDGRNGLLVRPGNQEEIAGAITRLVRDPALRARLGQQLKQDVMVFHPDRVSALVAKAAQDTLDPRPARRANRRR